MKFSRLLAKSVPLHEPWQGAATYVGHISAVMRSADTLVTHLGTPILQQLGLSHISPECFAATVRLGAYLHDWGKANQHFQIMVRLKDLKDCKDEQERKQQKQLQEFWSGIHQRQMIRHEILSGMLAMQVPSFRNWLEQCPNADFHTAVWSAMGHHLKIGGKKGKETGQITEIPDGTGAELSIYTRHENFTALLKMGVRYLGLPETLPEQPEENWTRDALEEAIDQLHEEFVDFEEKIEKDSELQRFIAAVKATVITADIAGSALPNTEYQIEDWIKIALKLVLTKEELQSLINQRLGNNTLRRFQQDIADAQERVTLVQAGCGTGKTVAAYAWGRRHAIDRKLFFGYPTTGTASQGYLDYAAETSIETLLMHSRAAIDLEAILFSNEAKHENNSEDSEDAERIDARLASFSAWQSKLIVCTVDSVLGLIQNNRKPLYAWPALCQSAFVFDEVHAYDDELFGALLRFLKTFRGAPTLLMSASFSEGQLKAIRQVIEEELQETLRVIPGPQNLEALHRYTLHQIPDDDAAWKQVEVALQANQKVLWVTNTVGSCIALYQEANRRLKRLGLRPPLIYHSRYRYQDRVSKHTAVVEAFKTDGAVLAITTQVCEMSLDLSAHLLVSAMAPAAALIQRLGRLNRKVIDNEENIYLASGKVCPALIYDWTERYPYDEKELITGKQLLAHLPLHEISQQNLAEAAALLESKTPDDVYSSWLDGHWRSYPRSTRKAGYTLTVLLEEDIPKIRKIIRQSGKFFGIEAQRWTVSIPLVDSFAQWEREGVYPVAPKAVVKYSEETGAELCKKA
jgi:CRISPR-associated endonuclease/helicase Cas3